jgi:chloramphenicol 3-O-phosphotransferase
MVRPNQCRCTLAAVPRVEGGDEGERRFLRSLIDCVHDQTSFSHLVVPTVDHELIRAQLQRMGEGAVEIESIAGNHVRTDAVVVSEGVVARIVFARDGDGLLTWLHAHVKPPAFDGVEGGQIIVVNGPSGAGKSTLMVALQSHASFPLVVLDEPEHIGAVQPGYLIWRDTAPALQRGYLAAIRALACSGNHVVLSAAGRPHGEISDAFEGVPIIRVGMRCDFSVLVDREQRTGRWAGIAAQSLSVHDGWAYDLEFDTTHGPDPAGLAERVLQLVAR